MRHTIIDKIFSIFQHLQKKYFLLFKANILLFTLSLKKHKTLRNVKKCSSNQQIYSELLSTMDLCICNPTELSRPAYTGNVKEIYIYITRLTDLSKTSHIRNPTLHNL